MSLLTYSTPEMTMIRDDLAHAVGDVRRVHDLVHEAFLVVLRSIRARSSHSLIPVIALRGGLLAYRSAAIVFGGPIGLIAPRGRPPYDHRAYGDVPVGDHYLVIDTIANTGETLAECVSGLRSRTSADVQVTFLFGTSAACMTLETVSPEVRIDAAWTDFERGNDGRLIGVSYDAGDYAMMDPHGDRIAW